MGKTASERMKKYREKLQLDREKYEELLQKQRIQSKDYRERNVFGENGNKF